MKEKTCLNSFFFGLSSQCLFEKMSLLANSSQALSRLGIDLGRGGGGGRDGDQAYGEHTCQLIINSSVSNLIS